MMTDDVMCRWLMLVDDGRRWLTTDDDGLCAILSCVLVILFVISTILIYILYINK